MKFLTISLGMFIVLLAIGFFIFMQFVPEIDPDKILGSAVDSTAMYQDTTFKVYQLDSLENMIKELQQKLFAKNNSKDSLQKLVIRDSSMLESKETSIERLKKKLKDSKKSKLKIKELAKSFEAMKLKEMRPILENVDNETALKIYEVMSGRSRKKLLLALPEKRAAEITQGIINSG